MIMYFTFKTYPGGGAFVLFFHPHPREFATQNKKSANARGLARGGGWAQLELTGALIQALDRSATLCESGQMFYMPTLCIKNWCELYDTHLPS